MILVVRGGELPRLCCKGASSPGHQGRAESMELAVPSAMGSRDRSCRLVWLSVPGTAV